MCWYWNNCSRSKKIHLIWIKYTSLFVPFYPQLFFIAKHSLFILILVIVEDSQYWFELVIEIFIKFIFCFFPCCSLVSTNRFSTFLLKMTRTKTVKSTISTPGWKCLFIFVKISREWVLFLFSEFVCNKHWFMILFIVLNKVLKLRNYDLFCNATPDLTLRRK